MACDVVIAGGGLSGLACAVAVAQTNPQLDVRIFEARNAYVRDRTWSFWQSKDLPAMPLPIPVRATWSRWQVGLGNAAPSFESPGIAYVTVDADAVYKHFLEQLGALANVRLELGVELTLGVAQGERELHAVTPAGDFRPAVVIDARGPTAPKPGQWVQHFVGVEIQTEADVWGSAAMTLMRFVPARDAVHFIYVLPYGPRRALVESTQFSVWSADTPWDAHEAALAQAIAQEVGNTAWQTHYRERGALPLRFQSDPPTPHAAWLKAGAAAGTMRPSTGYAFIDSLHHAQRLGRAVAALPWPQQGGAAWRAGLSALPRWHTAAVDQWMDRLFYEVLADDWQRAPKLFAQLFERAPTDAVVRFMAGRARWQDRMRVIAALPKTPFLRGLLRPGASA
jgi:lycopene beta-cyclase